MSFLSRTHKFQTESSSEDIDFDEIVPENCNIQQDEDEWRDSECFNLSAFNGFSLQEQFILSEDTGTLPSLCARQVKRLTGVSVLESRMSSTVEPVVEVGKEQVCKGGCCGCSSPSFCSSIFSDFSICFYS